MNILELDSYNLGDAVKFNKELNPRIWQNNTMRPEVRAKLLEIAADFQEFLGLGNLEVKDITVSGSNAGYSYTPHSDIDLHLVVDIPRADSDEVYRELFDAKKSQYNDLHDITIGGYDVELYVENANKSPVSQGVYSVLNNDWINIPKRRRATIDDDAVRSKYEDLKQRIDHAVESHSVETISRLAEKIKHMRQAGLDTHGELGSENLAYKMLRTQGYIQKLYDARNTARDQELSLKERRKPNSVFTYGFKHEESAEPDAVQESETPAPSLTDEQILKNFIGFCVKELKIEIMPIVKLRKDPEWSVRNKTFGRYINDQQMLEVAWGQRHVMDVLRTVAHELTHRYQHERDGDKMGPDAGETGSPYENEANARAGILMRDYAGQHPEFFNAGQADALGEGASGYIPTKKQARDPRYSMALTQDIKPGQLGKEANKLKLKTDTQGHPQVARANGLFEKLSLELAKFKKDLADEDYSPNNPPGPEFKPTMPKGTVKVGVSDVYDWYKLGQHISNMKGLGKHDFGQGPPGAILSFGDEKTEHKFIQDLKATGLEITDIDPVDPKQPKGMRGIKTDPTYNVTESEQNLNEVRMAPSNLMQWATSPEAQGVRAGFEAELIFRDTTNGDDGGEMEPDYDQDERCRSIQQVIDFFDGGDYGGLSSRQRNKLEEGLDEQYLEWFDEQMYAAWRDERDELIRDAWLAERPMSERIHAALVDGLELDDRQADEVERLHDQRANKEITGAELNDAQLEMASQYSEARTIADDILDEEVEQTIEKEDGFYDEVLEDFRGNFYLDDDTEFFNDVDLRYMSDVANSYDLEWPYMTDGGNSNNGSRDWDSIGTSLQDTIDMPVKVSSGYHSATRKEGLWIVEPDSSLEPDDTEDYGLEIVSPPMPLLVTLDKLQEVCDWANDSSEGNAYTNGSTGLHMGVSVPYKGGDVDYLKLILFLGDEYVLQSFGREANTYAKSAMSKFRENLRGGRVDVPGTMKLMQKNLIELAEREVRKGVGDGKYTSAHIQKGYIEFRSAGGDWLAEESADPEKLQNTMLRYAYAMSLAANPAAERREYAKKLYKLIAPDGDDQLALFSQYTAGELSPEQLKKRWAEKTLNKEKPKGDETEWEAYDPDTGKTLATTKNFSITNATNYFRDTVKLDRFQVREREPEVTTPRAKLAKRIATTKSDTVAQDIAPDVAQNFDTPQDATQVPRNWEFVDRITGQVIHSMSNASYDQANVVQDNLEGQNPAADIYLRSVSNLEENFADGRNPQDKGDSARHGIPKGATMAQLEKAAKASGRKGQLARWQLNMRRGKKK